MELQVLPGTLHTECFVMLGCSDGADVNIKSYFYKNYANYNPYFMKFIIGN